MEIIDITAAVHPGLVKWPDDTVPPSQEFVNHTDRGDPATVSQWTLSAHTGTHVDAPCHFVRGGATLDHIHLEVLVGRAQVIEITNPESITVAELRAHPIGSAERVLFKTRNSSLPVGSEFHEDFVYVEGEAAEYLVEQGVRLVGVDYLSVDKYGSESNPAHHTLLGRGVVIIEGLVLSSVEPGAYTLVCLPLKVVGAEGAPVRAILIR